MQFSPNSANFTSYADQLSGLAGFNLVNNGLTTSGNLIIGAKENSAIYDGDLDPNYPTTSTLFNMSLTDIGAWNNGESFIPFSKLQLNVKHEDTTEATKPQLMLSQFQDETSGSDWSGIFHRFSYNNSANTEYNSAIAHYEIRPIGVSEVAYSFGSHTNINNSKNGFILGGTNNGIFTNNLSAEIPISSENCYIFNSQSSDIYDYDLYSGSVSAHIMNKNGIIGGQENKIYLNSNIPNKEEISSNLIIGGYQNLIWSSGMDLSIKISNNLIFGGKLNEINNLYYNYSIENCNIYNGISNTISNVGNPKWGPLNLSNINLFGNYNIGSKPGEFIFGQYMNPNDIFISPYSLIFGNGTSSANRLNVWIINSAAQAILRNSANQFIGYDPISIYQGNNNNFTAGATWIDIISGANEVKTNHVAWNANSQVSAMYNKLYNAGYIAERKNYTLDNSAYFGITSAIRGTSIIYQMTNSSILRLDQNSGFTNLAEAISAIEYVKSHCNMTLSFDEYYDKITNVQINFFGDDLPEEYLQSWHADQDNYKYRIFQIPLFQPGGLLYDKIKNQPWFNENVFFIDRSGPASDDIIINVVSDFYNSNCIKLVLHNDSLISAGHGWYMNFNLHLG